jgi:molecular chaperone Hsp33
MLNDSRLYSFLDNEHGFTLYFLEGQKLFNHLVVLHELKQGAFAYYRDTILSSLQMINFLKVGETLGFYIDSEDPYFRFKVEMANNGDFRTLLLPDSFNKFPKEITGQSRISKVFPQKKPYTSIIELKNTHSETIINEVLKESYQTNSEVVISEVSDQSLMFTKMPPMNVDKEVWEDISLKEYQLKNKQLVNDLFNLQTDNIEKIVQHMEKAGLTYLQSKKVAFNCACSKERFIFNLKNLNVSSGELFEGKESLEVKCDYCLSRYDITKKEVDSEAH